MTENPEASVLTARRAAQHFRLFRANDAYEHLCILTLLPSLAPLHLMLADTPWPHGFGATLTNVGGSVDILGTGGVFRRRLVNPMMFSNGQEVGCQKSDSCPLLAWPGMCPTRFCRPTAVVSANTNSRSRSCWPFSA